VPDKVPVIAPVELEIVKPEPGNEPDIIVNVIVFPSASVAPALNVVPLIVWPL
jgi:hypothetical protein